MELQYGTIIRRVRCNQQSTFTQYIISTCLCFPETSDQVVGENMKERNEKRGIEGNKNEGGREKGGVKKERKT